MIKLIGRIPVQCTVAFSGGVDSVAATDFIIRGKKNVKIAFFHHGTIDSDAGEKFSIDFATKRGLKLDIGRISDTRPRGISEEEYWRNERYKFLDTLQGPVVTAHHLDDAMETWIFTSLHGKSRLIPYSRGNVIRPFLATPKEQLISWSKRHDLDWIEDSSNTDTRHMRNLIRHKIVPEALRVNPGLRTVIRKKYEAEFLGVYRKM